MKTTHICQICKNIFECSNNKQRPRKYCSPKCYHQSLINNANLDQYRNKKCLRCNIDFISKETNKNNILRNKYCSKQCRRLHQGLRQKRGSDKICLENLKSIKRKKSKYQNKRSMELSLNENFN